MNAISRTMNQQNNQKQRKNFKKRDKNYERLVFYFSFFNHKSKHAEK